MKNIILLLFCFMNNYILFGTAQIPDLLIYNNDTVKLYANPLESFYNDNNPRPDNIGVGDCWSTACWRGYQAIWEIKDKKLYLNSILDCCFWEKYLITKNILTAISDHLPQSIIEELEKLKDQQYDLSDFKEKLKKNLGKKEYKKYRDIILKAALKPRQKADLSRLFPGQISEGKVLAFWFSGDITIPKGNMIEYVHMGYMSRYEKELVLTIENGELTDEIEYENKTYKIENGYGVLQATAYSLVVPLDLINNKNGYVYTMTDTVNYSNISGTKSLSALSKFNNSRKEKNERIILVESTIDSLSNILNNNFTFKEKKTEKLRWGTGCWIDGQSKTNSESIRIFTISNINSQLVIEYKEKNIKPNDFEKKADYIIYSTRLMEFGY